MASSFITDLIPHKILRRLFPGYRLAPAVRSQRYHLRNTYIMPTRAGMGLLLVVLLILLAAINFQNSLVYVVCFWLGSLLVINILYTFRNLHGLKIELMGAEPCFAGQNSLVTLRASSIRPSESIYIGWEGVDLALFALPGGHSREVVLSYPALKRGRLHPPRLKVFTRYPSGLTVAWGYANLDINVIAYPAPRELEAAASVQHGGEDADDGLEIAGGVNDFSGLRAYQHGDRLRHIHWPTYARTGTLHSKAFVDYQQHDQWLSWDDLPPDSVERRLSHLCARVLVLDSRQQSFGMRIPGTTIQPDHGEAHRVACLTALALFRGEV